LIVGDGINDIPALSVADICIAIGFTGAEITSDIVDVDLINDILSGNEIMIIFR
jgi:cation transport ATPase